MAFFLQKNAYFPAFLMTQSLCIVSVTLALFKKGQIEGHSIARGRYADALVVAVDGGSLLTREVHRGETVHLVRNLAVVA